MNPVEQKFKILNLNIYDYPEFQIIEIRAKNERNGGWGENRRQR